MPEKRTRGSIQKMARKSKESLGLGDAFSQGLPEAIAAVEKIVGGIVATKGYGIPLQERQDLQQEIMTQLWKASQRTDLDRGVRFPGFVSIVASRRCVDWYRAQRTKVELDEQLPDEAADASSAAALRERRTLALAAVASLKKPCRELISLRFVEEKSYAELAEMLGANETAVRVRLHRCIAAARDRLRKSNVVPMTPRRSA